MKNKNLLGLIPGTDLHELSIKGKIFYSEDENYFNIPMFCLKDVLLNDLPIDVEIAISGPTHVFIESTINQEIPEFTICRINDMENRVRCNIELNPKNWNYDINPTLFLYLKSELIIKLNEENPIIESQNIENYYLGYSIEVEDATITEAIDTAYYYNAHINRIIMSAVKNLPRLLLESLGIKETSRPLGPWILRAE